ncbi:MAG: aminotransferase class I/II-fold pyridoxal phosphate-dependent enzyme [Actinomycetales bacterium]|nr:aminotransferase class I/II-fold pyridoxal phosphate-dependent enzyme [Actinomycetales bacterium]
MSSREMRPDLSPETLVVAVGRPAKEPDAPVNVPVVLSSTFHAGGPIAYARTSNPTWEALEEVVGALEGGRALAFSSGMGAVSAVLDLVPNGGTVVVSSHSYSGVAARLRDLEADGRVRVRLVPVQDAASVAESCTGADLLWIETPTNPAMEVCDLAAVAAAARELGVLTVCDNTFAGPMLQRPIEHGVDVVVHSATKSLAGHSDVLLGIVVTTDDDYHQRLLRARTLVGSIPGPFEAYLALRGIRTLALRVKQSQASALELATRLSAHPAVTSVRYPGLPDDPGHEIAKRQMDGFGAIVAFETVGDADAAEAFCDRTELITHATSLGGVETLMERRRRWPEERPDVPETLIRLSVGIEDVEDLWADLSQALDGLL